MHGTVPAILCILQTEYGNSLLPVTTEANEQKRESNLYCTLLGEMAIWKGNRLTSFFKRYYLLLHLQPETSQGMGLGEKTKAVNHSGAQGHPSG